MKNWFIVFNVCVLIILQGLSQPAKSYAAVVYRCHMCGMDAASSQTEFVVSFDDGSQEHACCLHCVYLLGKFIKDRTIKKTETRDFTTGLFIDAQTANYLAGSSLIPKGSMAPFLLAFSSKEIAEKYLKKYKGYIVGFKGAMDIAASFDQENSINQ